MGFESFRVEFKGDANTFVRKGGFLQQFPQAMPDPNAIPIVGSSFYLVNDGRHVFEFEISESTSSISLRFTLCQPESIIQAFVSLVRDVMVSFEMSVKIRDDVQPQHSGWYPIARFDEFAEIVLDFIARRRAEWIAHFGPELSTSSTSEIYQRFVLPKCMPVGQETDVANRDYVARSTRAESAKSL